MARETIQSGAVLGVCFWFALYITPPASLQEAGKSDRREKKKGEQLKGHEAHLPLNTPYWGGDFSLNSGVNFSKMPLSSKPDLDTLKLPGTEVTVSHHQTGKRRSKVAETDCRISIAKDLRTAQTNLPGRGY